jgi:WD40 repeat protein
MSNGVLVSVGSSGQKANAGSYFSYAAGDGRYVLFSSDATNLSSIDPLGRSTFIRDTQEGWTQPLEVGPDGQVAQATFEWRLVAQSNPIEPLHVAFTTDGFGEGFNLYYRDVEQGTTELIARDISRVDYMTTVGGQQWHYGHYGFSSDGEFLAYASSNAQIVPGDDNGRTDVFVEELATGDAVRISEATNGTAANGDSYVPFFSPDGRYVAFTSAATNLGPTDTNGSLDVYIKDLATGEVQLVSKGFDGGSANWDSTARAFSPDGRYLMFESRASNIVAGDDNGRIDVFLYDRETGQTIRVSQTADGVDGNGDSVFGAFVPSTNVFCFITFANNLLDGDTNGVRDVVYSEIGSGIFQRLDFDGPIQPNDDVLTVASSGDGNFAFLTTEATNLAPGDNDSIIDIVRVPLSQILQAASIRGGPQADDLAGSERDDYILGFDGDDTVSASPGSDLVDGGPGTDTFHYDFGASEIGRSIRTDGSVQVTKPDSSVDTLLSVERVETDDGNFLYGLSENVEAVYRIYAAAYGRTPDEGGLRFWTDQLDQRGGGAPDNADKEFLAGFFLTANEFTDLYGANPSDYDYIDAMYENVLARLPDQAGYDFWVGQMQQGLGRDDILIHFAESDENKLQTAPDLADGIWVL